MRVFLFAAALMLVGCAENPADSADKAQVSHSTGSPSPAAMATGTPAAIEGKHYTISPDNSKVEWTGSKVTGSHDGGFKKFAGEIVVADNNAEKSQVHIDIDVDSIYSDSDKLTGHLKSPDFFDVAKFPQASFHSTEIKKEGEKFNVSGDLTMHGVTNRITFPAEIKTEGDQVSAKAQFSINRMDFGIKYPGKADDLIREEVVIKLDLKPTPK
jgi:polyisoprenoid-binding protein YceI